MDPLASADDVADIWRPLSAAEQTQATRLIGKASAMLRAACPFDIDVRIALADTDPGNPQALDPTLVATVVAGMVKRVMVNPDGAAAKTETTGPYSSSTSFTSLRDPGSAQETRGDLVVLAEDIQALRPKVGFAQPFTINTRSRHGRRR
jgi:hypothetical protein